PQGLRTRRPRHVAVAARALLLHGLASGVSDGEPSMQRLATCAFAALALAACQGANAPADDTTPAAASANPATPAAGEFAFHDAIDAADFGHHVEILASDAFEGRGPGTPGGEKTVEYIRDQME